MSSNSSGILFTLLSGVFFGLLGFFGMNALHLNLSVYTMLFWRFLVSGTFLFCLFLPQMKRLKYTRSGLQSTWLHGIFFYSTSSILYFIASQHIGSGIAMVIFFTYPALVMLINIVLKQEKLNTGYLVALIIIMSGMLLLMKNSADSPNLTGIFLAFLAAFLYAIYIAISKKNKTSPLPATMMLSAGCMLTCFAAACIDHTFTVPTGKVWFYIAGIGIVCTALPILFLLKGLKHLDATQAAILTVLEPVFVVLSGVILLHETVTPLQTLGVAVVLTGALISLRS